MKLTPILFAAFACVAAIAMALTAPESGGFSPAAHAAR
jgi:hypothetical protein